MTPAPRQPVPRRSGSAGAVRRALLAAAAALATLAPPVSGQLVPKEVPAPARGLEVQNKQGQPVPEHLVFTDESGKTVSLGDLLGRPVLNAAGQPAGDARKPVVLLLVYFNCPVMCPAVLAKLTGTLDRVEFTVGREYDVVVVSFDPRDTPEAAAREKGAQLLAYPRAYRTQLDRDPVVAAGWHFLTGEAAQSKALADAVGFPYRYLPESGEFSHGSGIFLLTPEGTVARYLSFEKMVEPKDVRLALVEASEGKVGTIFDAFTLLCYHFDPSAGTYTLQAMRVMQTGGIATVLLLGGALAVLWRKELARRLIGARRADPARPWPTAAETTGHTP